MQRNSEMKITATAGAVLLTLLIQTATAQNVNFKGPVVYAEIAGAGGSGISLNFEHEIFYKSNWFLNARIGYGAAKIAGVHANSVPVGISLFHGARKSHIEVGAALSYAEGRQYYLDHGPLSKALYFVPSLSYRLQKPSGGFF